MKKYTEQLQNAVTDMFDGHGKVMVVRELDTEFDSAMDCYEDPNYNEDGLDWSEWDEARIAVALTKLAEDDGRCSACNEYQTFNVAALCPGCRKETQ